ncbi:MAG: hypothetical protein ACK4MF_06530 [Hyphomicrobiaceae bacterium]
MYDRVLAILSLAFLAGFLAVIGLSVESTPLRAVLAVTALLAAYDFWRTLVRCERDKSG